ncbi:hypothetical protein [Sphingomonas sp. LT1P40]|uniref:hypothetical protein n=1 Tax=Alteristakelama amylovorans TaxID=3096166 RepID=UPI002FCB6912
MIRISRHEAPIFTALKRTSFSFAFELRYLPRERPAILDALYPADRTRERVAFRLKTLMTRMLADKKRRDDELERRKKMPDKATGTDLGPDVFGDLVEPVRSFLDDVTTGPPGTNGRPFLFLASAQPPDDASRTVHFHRQPKWDYEFEGVTTSLRVPEQNRIIELRLRDSFCAFESGRLFYILTLTQPEKQPQPIDEYALIQLQQLALSPKTGAIDTACAAFSFSGIEKQSVSLAAFAEQRLRALETDPDDMLCNGIRHIIKPYGLGGDGLERRKIEGAHLQRLCIGVEDDRLLAVAEHAIDMFKPVENVIGTTSAAPGEQTAEPGVPLVERLDLAWRKRYVGKPVRPPFHIAGKAHYSRPLLTFAGMAQGVPDFPAQDESEVHDSTRPTARSVESALFTHPRFMMEVAKAWRSYQRGRPALGTCPYLLLTFLVAVHDELVVTELENRIERMIYAASPPKTVWRRIRGAGQWVRTLWRRAWDQPSPFLHSRSRPMADVRDVLDRANHWFVTDVGILESNLRRRLELFRWTSIHRSGNIFRYPKEKNALTEVRVATGTDERFRNAHDMVDRMESLIEDVSNLKSSYAERRTNAILFGLAALGLIQLPANMGQSWEMLLRMPRVVAFLQSWGVEPKPMVEPVQESRPAKSS